MNLDSIPTALYVPLVILTTGAAVFIIPGALIAGAVVIGRIRRNRARSAR